MSVYDEEVLLKGRRGSSSSADISNHPLLTPIVSAKGMKILENEALLDPSIIDQVSFELLREAGVPLGDCIRLMPTTNSELVPKPPSTTPAAASTNLLNVNEGCTKRSKYPGKNDKKPLVIVDFINSDVFSGRYAGSTISHLFNRGYANYCKGEAKPSIKLDDVTLAQWVSANVKILQALINKPESSTGTVKDYLEYTAKIGQLAEKFIFTGVLHFDNDFRHMQAATGCRWNSESGTIHLSTLHLRPLSRTPHFQNYRKRPIAMQSRRVSR